MKFVHWFGVCLVALLLGVDFGVAHAAKAPPGSYRDDCRSISASRDVLRARCDKGRRRVWARLSNYSSCVGDISSYQGQLICLRKKDVPRGDWSDSCINPHLASPGVFAAVCKSLRGGWIASEIALDKCSDGFTNARGHLGCKKAKEVELPSPTAPRATVPPRAAPADEPPEEPAGPSQPPPTGAYQDTCREIAFDGRYLSGECRNDRGRWQDTSLDTKSCSRGQVIGNDDGELVCTRRPGQEPPAGLYQQTCKDVTFDGRFVRADCKDAKGTWMRALLDVRECEAGDQILNDDAEIVCRAPPPPPPPPPSPAPPAPVAPPSVTTPVAPHGTPSAVAPAAPPPSVTTPVAAPPPSVTTPVPRREPPAVAPAAPAPQGPTPGALAPTVAPSAPPPAPAAPVEPAPPPPSPTAATPALPATPEASITLYDGKGFEGASKTLTGDAPDLGPLGWTKIASSVQVVGVWELCEEPNYGGQCQRIEDDEPSLADLNLNDRVASLRQVRTPKAPAKP